MKPTLPSENPDARQIARLATKLRKAGDHEGARRLVDAAIAAGVGRAAGGGWTVAM